MAFVWPDASNITANAQNADFKADVICVPAIGADARSTWAGVGEEGIGWLGLLQDKLPSINVLLYDHLEPGERRLELKDALNANITRDFAAAEKALASFGVEDYARRFLSVVEQYRRLSELEQRPIVFICHSTGGIVVKSALSAQSEDERSSLAKACIGITFFATPHHGSSVLSSPEFVMTVQRQLGLKWKMSERLRRDFSLQSQERKQLNYRFAVAAMGIKIYSYVERQDTKLDVLSAFETGGESLVEVNFSIVDNRSAQLGTPDVPVEEEDVIDLNATHTGVARFMKEDNLRRLFVDELVLFLESFSLDESKAYDKLSADILDGTKLDVHQFYRTNVQGESAPNKLITSHPSLKFFFDFGPTEALKARIEVGKRGNPSLNGKPKPAIKVRHPSEPMNPIITVHAGDDNDAATDGNTQGSSGKSLTAPVIVPPANIHTRRPSVQSLNLDPLSIRRPSLSVEDGTTRQARSVQFAEKADLVADSDDPTQKAILYGDTESSQRPQRSVTYQLPTSESNLFRWMHVPSNHTGWVPHVLTTISREKQSLDLHTNLLMDQVWLFQHNRSRHASPHARFVRPLVKILPPKVDDPFSHHFEGSATPRSAVNEVQLVLYMPYLHWDSFQKLQERAAVIKKRREETKARPNDAQIAEGKSLESKLIWQYLLSDLPVHTRRTLDQYGYPSLRNTAVRDGDQVLYKRTKADKETHHSREPVRWSKRTNRNLRRQSLPANAVDDGAAKVLMVDQLWLWVLDGKTVVTFASPKEKDENDGGLWKQADFVSNIYQDVNGDFARRCDDPFDFAALAVFHAVKALLDHTNDLNLQVFRIFEEYISILTERQTSSFKDFRDNNRSQDALSNPLKRLPRYFDNSSDLDALLELRDIEDELHTLDKLFKEQQKSVSEMTSQYHQLNQKHNKGQNGTIFLREVSDTLDGYKEQIDLMLKSAQTAQKAYKELLDMKQKQANIDEAHLSREQTEVAAEQSRSIMIFTIFTIIFLPLSFFASVFGINAREWSGQSTNLSLHTIFVYMGTISLAVIIVALLVAFNKFTRKITQRVWQKSLGPLVYFYWSLRRRPPPPDVKLALRGMTAAPAVQGMAFDLEKWAAIDASRHQKRLSTISRTYSKMQWDEELGPRGYG